MKKIVAVTGLLMAGVLMAEAQSHDDHEGHDHVEQTFQSAQSHNTPEGQIGKSAPLAESVPHDHDGDGMPDHAVEDDHSGHDHGEVEGVKFTQEMFDKLGIQVHAAEGGMVARSSVFPAEVKLNRDTTVAVSPRYPSIVLQVFAEIGDEVKKGDALASLENRETMAVYSVAAPREGVIITKDLAPGETAGDDQVLFEVADLSSVWADISVFPQYQHLLRKGMPVTFIAHDGHQAQGKIRYISPIVSHETRTFTARCILLGADEDFTPGAFVRARINVEQTDARVVVPRAAVQMLDGESVVFVPSPNGFIPTVVSTGLADDRTIEIRTGLNPGDRFVAVGAFALKAQMVTGGMDPHAGHGH
ncbi:efflux RND transporter periplasmic adaptor subunit [Pontiellaceae bacterium B1224]|nr:efflux RND transporter periplasmic adaptor subunit [Pontiellaceae bacterium B1224]